MIGMMAAILLGSAVLFWPARRSPADRLRAISDPGTPGAAQAAVAETMTARRRGLIVAVWAGLAGFLVVGGLAGLMAGALLAGGAFAVVHRREPAAVRRVQDRLLADLPFAADLLVACLRAGQPLAGAVEITARAVGGPLGDRLSWVGAQLRLGADPETAWAALAADPPLAVLARTMARAAQTGAPVADALVRLADDTRLAVRAASLAAVRRVGVQAVAPLGLCFLPAFVLIGIVPVVAGLAGRVLLP